MKTKKAEKDAPPRKVLVILSNRFNRSQPSKYFELLCQTDGGVLEEKKLRKEPTKPVYDEVWENDEGKTDMDFCRSMKRKYGHKLEKPAA